MFEHVDEGHVDGEKPVTYYYNREERIARAPESVKKYYRGEMNPVKGFRVLFNGPNKYILFALIFFVGVCWVYSGFNRSRNYIKAEGLDCEVMSYSYEDQVYSSVSIKWNIKTDAKSKGDRAIKVEFFMVNADNQVVEKQVLTAEYTAADNETKYLRMKNTDFDIVRCDVILTVNNTEKEISTAVKR